MYTYIYVYNLNEKTMPLCTMPFVFRSDRVCVPVRKPSILMFSLYNARSSYFLFLPFLSIAGRLKSAKLIIKRRGRKSVRSLKEREKENKSRIICRKSVVREFERFEIQARIESKLTSPCSGKWIKGSPSDR